MDESAAPETLAPLEIEAAPRRRAGPTDITDPALREEAKKALVWAVVVGLVALAVLLAQALLVVFGGLVFGALIDGGARLLGRVLPIGGLKEKIRAAQRAGITTIMIPRRNAKDLEDVPAEARDTLKFVLLAGVGFGIWLVEFAGSQIADQASALPAMIGGQAMKGMHWAQRHGLRLDAKFTQNLVEGALARVTEVTAVVGGVLGGMTTLFLILVLGIYFAIDPAPYRRGLAWMLPRENRDDFEHTLLVMGKALRRLLMGRLIGMMVEGLMIYVALALYGVPMAALLGMIAALLAFLPNIGAPISGLLMVLVGFSGGTSMGLYCIGVFAVVMGVDGNIIVPLVAKRTADLAPALVLAMQLVMGLLFGILGLALADPLLAMLKVLLERRSDLTEAREA